MAEKILIDVESIIESKKVIDESIEIYSTYSKQYLSDVIERLKPFNSDFVSNISGALDNMKDTKAPKLVEALQKYSRKLEIVVESFTESDIALSEIMAPKE